MLENVPSVPEFPDFLVVNCLAFLLLPQCIAWQHNLHRRYNRIAEVPMSRLAGLLALAALLLARTGSPRTPQSPKIRVATHLVEIGVIVRDKNSPVGNLTKDDFVVLDRGRAQKVSIFSAGTAGPGSQPQQSQAQATINPLPRNTFSDLPQYSAPPRSTTIVLFDNLNTLYGSAPASRYEKTPLWVEDLALQNARNHLIEFIKQLQPEDRVAIYGLTHSLHVVCDFTSDRGQLLSILKSYDTRSVTNREIVEPGKIVPDVLPIYRDAVSGFENGAAMQLAGASNEDRAAETMAALQEIAGHVGNIPGRKNLVWLTANLPFSGAEMARILTPANIAVYQVDARGLLGESPTVAVGAYGTADFDDVSGASGHRDNMPAQSSQPIGITTMQKLADETGGQAFVNTNDITGAIRKAVEDSEVTYTLGFYIDKDSLDGKFHEIKVDVNRKGLTVRCPKGYFAFPDNAADTNADQQMLLAAVESPIEFSMIPLQASLQRANQADPNVFNLVCSIDLHDIRFTQSGNLRKGALTVYVIGQSAAGRVLHNWSKTYNLQFTDNQYADLPKSGIPFHQGIQLHPDVKTLRIVVEDPATAHIGSLIIPLSQIN
jgi:VWFA-related protein